ncbi:MAG: phosphoribosylglycinamide formyltransferase [Devosiaceae bacterium]|nr:phosphoribosylglycinamide formyltransferase [Devosiaceae bacterium]
MNSNATSQNTKNKKNVVILISGRGSNMLSLIKAAEHKDFPAKIAGVISSDPDAAGLKIAKNHGIKTAINELKTYPDKTSADRELTKVLQKWQAQIICLAGFMRILGDDFTEQWHKKTINIHPSLLPKYKGLNTHQRAIDANDKTHGCTVHFVISELDAGAIIEQTEVEILPDDDAQSLAQRVLIEEHILYPKVLAKLAAK